MFESKLIELNETIIIGIDVYCIIGSIFTLNANFDINMFSIRSSIDYKYK